MTIQQQSTVAIIGAGLMGHGIGYVLARAGHHVQIFDTSKKSTGKSE
jgi:3-hydroxyacyl-CoA dehydrogenase